MRSRAARRAEAHIEDGIGLDLGQSEAAHQVRARGFGRRERRIVAITASMIVEGDLEAFEDMGAALGAVQLELRSAG